ncbi:hypothetical protein X760_31290 [Mesorhizobium sp. LSHC422A00]|uniref:hypothetical protein n=1 Tax=Mesorhizobium sp. LSHC422A00 TaxID=1287294 RepID=UPI0003CDD9FF|nr:hypothetical protein [Mesorhizobium sp. LSHC422A00]ESX51839.1 hypothetical protein X760_31290 [Mesorhizobium sp. LSHC422A00]
MLPTLNPGIIAALRSGDQKYITDYEENGPKLSICDCRDHGASLQIEGRKRNAVQYEIGNPVTASKMTRHKVSAGLYARGSARGRTGRSFFEYDRPSTLFGQFGDKRVTEVGRYSMPPSMRFCARLPNRKQSPR